MRILLPLVRRAFLRIQMPQEHPQVSINFAEDIPAELLSNIISSSLYEIPKVLMRIFLRYLIY